MKGFYVPNSISSSYIANKRNGEGSLAYQSMANEVGLQRQAALQDLSQQYASTIENAYAAYLAGQRGIAGSAMGQGYKDAYMQNQQQAMMQQVAETNATAAKARQELAAQEADVQEQIQKQFEEEVSYFDRTAQLAGDYLSYLKTLVGQDGASTYISPEDSEKSVDVMYDVIFGAQPQGYLDAEGNKGLSYLQWVNQNLGKSSADNAYAQWLFGRGGYQDFVKSTKTIKK